MIVKMKSVATIKSPFCNLEDMPVQPCGAKDTYATIEFHKEYIAGLKDLDGFSHVYLIYYFHKIKNPQLEVVPFNDKTNTLRGVFSTRTPMHPNSIGLSLVELIGIEKNIVTIKGIDILNETPLLDIKPYIKNFDVVNGNIKNGWMKSTSNDVSVMRSDKRFL